MIPFFLGKQIGHTRYLFARFGCDWLVDSWLRNSFVLKASIQSLADPWSRWQEFWKPRGPSAVCRPDLSYAYPCPYSQVVTVERVRGELVPLISNIGIKWRWVIIRALMSLYPTEMVPMIEEYPWAQWWRNGRSGNGSSAIPPVVGDFITRYMMTINLLLILKWMLKKEYINMAD